MWSGHGGSGELLVGKKEERTLSRLQEAFLICILFWVTTGCWAQWAQATSDPARNLGALSPGLNQQNVWTALRLALQ